MARPEVTVKSRDLRPSRLRLRCRTLQLVRCATDVGEGKDQMLVGEIMTSPAVTVRDTTSVEAVIRLLAVRRLTMLPVVDAANRLVGVVSEADLLGWPEPTDPRAHLRPAPSSASAVRTPSVAELMVRSPHTTTEDADVAEVATLFHRSAWKCLPVMRDEQLVGVVSRSDIIRAMSRDDDDIEDDVNRLLGELAPGWEAHVSNGVVSITGPGPERQGDAAASLAATVVGVRAVHVSNPSPGPHNTAPPPEWTTDNRHVPLSSGAAVDEL